MTMRTILLTAFIAILALALPARADRLLLAQQPPGKAFQGDPISISLKDAPLQEAFRQIHQLSGRNIVVDQSVQGKTISLELRDVPWDQALALVLQTNRLRQVEDGNVIRVFPADDDDARATLMKARLAIDLGDHEEALALLSSLASDEAVPRDLRCEARVRKAALLAQDGRRCEANTLFMVVFEHCYGQPETMRLLAQAVTGIEQDPATWRGRTEKFVLEFSSTSAVDLPEPRIEYLADSTKRPIDSLPADGEEWQPTNFTGEPIGISMKDADLVDVLRLLESFSGMHMNLTSAARPLAKAVNLELRDVPWDQAFSLVLQTNRLRAVKVPGGFRIEPLPDADVTSSP